jgi:hypothetical protein
LRFKKWCRTKFTWQGNPIGAEVSIPKMSSHY